MDKLHILVVDDNHINRLFFQSALKKMSCLVTTAMDGCDAVEKCSHEKFNLILMDIRMDGMDGIEAAQIIKQNIVNSQTPVVAISAEQFDINKHPEFIDFLLKPVKQEDLTLLLINHARPASVFNQTKALKISHDDESIVNHLRGLFLEQLPSDQAEIKLLYQNKQYNQLHNKLHHFLGSAKVCAAELIINNVQAFKINLTADKLNSDELFSSLMAAIDITLKRAD